MLACARLEGWRPSGLMLRDASQRARLRESSTPFACAATLLSMRRAAMQLLIRLFADMPPIYHPPSQKHGRTARTEETKWQSLVARC